LEVENANRIFKNWKGLLFKLTHTKHTLVRSMTDVTFRNVNERDLRDFKAEAVRENKTFGEAIAEAIRLWVEHKQFAKRKKMKLSQSKPVDFGPGTENLSKRIDEILYSG